MEVWGDDLWEILRPIIVKLGPARVTKTLDEEGMDIGDVGGDIDFDAISDDRALDLLDSHAADPERCAHLAASVVASWGKSGGYHEFDHGVPGSGQANSVWQLGGWSFVVNSEMGVFEVHKNVREARKALKPL